MFSFFSFFSLLFSLNPHPLLSKVLLFVPFFFLLPSLSLLNTITIIYILQINKYHRLLLLLLLLQLLHSL